MNSACLDHLWPWTCNFLVAGGLCKPSASYLCPKNHGISKLMVWKSQNPAIIQSQTPLFYRVQSLILRVVYFYHQLLRIIDYSFIPRFPQFLPRFPPFFGDFAQFVLHQPHGFFWSFVRNAGGQTGRSVLQSGRLEHPTKELRYTQLDSMKNASASIYLLCVMEI